MNETREENEIDRELGRKKKKIQKGPETNKDNKDNDTEINRCIVLK